MNGRINFKEGGTPLFLQDKMLVDKRTMYDNLKYTQQNTALSNLYFSSKNMTIVQNAIRANVYKMSNQKYIIDEQNVDILNIIMRSIYLQNSLNQPDNLTKQIEDLNKLVIDYCVPRVYSEVEGYIQYKKDASTLAVPLSNPISVYTNKTLELNKFF
uniref:Minor capsid protein P8 central region domain-containing protein n=1 Tax=viral metagenome TaxID=1070528 RepID=A0A6C0JJF3_9ZZZZ